MTIKVYKNSDEKEVLNKSLYSENSFTAEMVNTDILFPRLRLMSTKFDYNYVYIPTFKRYYFVSEMHSLAGTHLILVCSVDPLMSFKEGILSLECSVVRNENTPIGEIVDEKLPVKCKNQIVSTLFGEIISGENRRFILTAV